MEANSQLALDQREEPFQYQGVGSELFGIYLKTVLLTIVTLGIYRFWGKVQINKYLFSHTSFLGRSFGYHATGKERFIGFLKGAAVVILLLIAAMMLPLILGPQTGQLVSSAMFTVIILGAQPLIIVGRHRYLLSRSSWSNVRFRFAGNFKEFAPMYYKGVLLGVLTLGIYSPWFINNILHYLLGKSNLGDKQFSFYGEGKKIFFIYLKGILLSIVTLGIYSFWYTANLIRYVFSQTELDGNKFNCKITGGTLFKIYLVSFLIVLFTLGFGLAFAVNYSMYQFFGKLSLEADAQSLKDLQNVSDSQASAFADGVSEAVDALDAIGSMI